MNVSLRRIAIAVAVSVFALGANAATEAIKATKANIKAEYTAAVARADADYRAAKDACKTRKGNDKDVCMKEAKGAHTKAIFDAKVARRNKDAMMEAKATR